MTFLPGGTPGATAISPWRKDPGETGREAEARRPSPSGSWPSWNRPPALTPWPGSSRLVEPVKALQGPAIGRPARTAPPGAISQLLGTSKQGPLNAYTRAIEHQEKYIPDLHDAHLGLGRHQRRGR